MDVSVDVPGSYSTVPLQQPAGGLKVGGQVGDVDLAAGLGVGDGVGLGWLGPGATEPRRRRGSRAQKA